MTRIIHLDSPQAERLAFSYSPLQEAVRSLQVLAKSKYHPLHLAWVLQIRQQMPVALRAEVSAFGIIFARMIPDIFASSLSLGSDFLPFTEEFRVTQELAAQDYAERVLNQAILGHDMDELNYPLEQISSSPELQEQILAQTAEIHPASVQMVQELLTNPQRSQERFLAFFLQYWEVCLAPQWPQLEELLLRDIQQRGQLLFEYGPREVLSSLAPQLNIYEEENNITMLYPAQGHWEKKAGNPLFLIPSSYVWPRLSFIYGRDVLHAIAYSIKQYHEEGNAPVPPERLLKLLRAAGDTTRMQILQLLSQRPRSTRELAGLLGLSEAGISKHVKMLQDVGFLRSERSSYYVLYQSVRDPLSEITRGLDRLLQPAQDEEITS
ncbi:ArsR family transcriptional regulator [Ktedonosporobacter rubrisoli]|uniref:ArsR family transcriptional regulator n=1 Tax=Ktedonosporobacter rubrisoli TaxID=2509675 RepID=A0A4P6JNK5_KTERU|nr:DUF5937 family protein [Ktedonosporobacter rubrisoli]QBD76864.1 ArsR family transcriptional regulator [Ktedonosporobacter rubrisoli]